jgi:predicted nucleic-acid-binding protein
VIGVDTNILVRFLTQDDEQQSAIVDTVVAQATEEGEVFFIDDIVMCELVWVLRISYRFDKGTIAAALEQMLGTGLFTFDDRDLLLRALTAYRDGSGDFADHLIAFRNAKAGCDTTITFDRGLRGSEAISLL